MDKSILLALMILYIMTDIVLSLGAISSGEDDAMPPISSGEDDATSTPKSGKVYNIPSFGEAYDMPLEEDDTSSSGKMGDKLITPYGEDDALPTSSHYGTTNSSHEEVEDAPTTSHKEVDGTINSSHEEVEDAPTTLHKEVDGTINSSHEEVDVTINSSQEEVDGTIKSSHEEVDGTTTSSHEEVDGTTTTSHEKVDGTITTSHEEADGTTTTSQEAVDNTPINSNEEVDDTPTTTSRADDAMPATSYDAMLTTLSFEDDGTTTTPYEGNDTMDTTSHEEVDGTHPTPSVEDDNMPITSSGNISVKITRTQSTTITTTTSNSNTTATPINSTTTTTSSTTKTPNTTTTTTTTKTTTTITTTTTTTTTTTLTTTTTTTITTTTTTSTTTTTTTTTTITTTSTSTTTIIISVNATFLVVDDDQVVGEFDDIEKAKERLQEVPGGRSRLIAEVDKDGNLQKDPHIVAGQKQEPQSGFNKWWLDWDDINRMMLVCEEYLKGQKEGVKGPIYSVSGISTKEATASIGSTLWFDRSYYITKMPEQLVGSTLFQPMHYVDKSTIEISSTQTAMVYVGVYESRDGGLMEELPKLGWKLENDWFVEWIPWNLGTQARLNKIWSIQIEFGQLITFTTTKNRMTFAIFVSNAKFPIEEK